MDNEQKIREAAGPRQDRVIAVLTELGLLKEPKKRGRPKKNAAVEGDDTSDNEG